MLTLFLLVLCPWTLWIISDGKKEELSRADVGVVLGGLVLKNKQPSPGLCARLDRTIDLYRAGYYPKILVTGGVKTQKIDETRLMRAYLLARGIPDTAILIDSKGENTYLSARNTAALARAQGWHRVLVITQYFHLPRTRLAFKRMGVETLYSACPQYSDLRDPSGILRELVGYPVYALRSYPP